MDQLRPPAIKEKTHPSSTPEWADMYANNAIISIRHYVCQRQQNENAVAYMRDFVSFIGTYWNEMGNITILVETTNRCDDPQCREMISSIPWLAAFINGEYNVKAAIDALSISPNHCTRLLIRFLVLLDNHIIMKEWKIEALKIIKSHETRSLRVYDYEAHSVSNYIERQCERYDMVIHALWISLKEAIQASLLHKERQATSSKVANFCILAGCPSSAQDPIKNVESLRKYLASCSSEEREQKLRQEMEELRKENQVQQRIITNLTFRHILENLPPGSSKKMSSTACWSQFFKNALQKAQSQIGVDSQHPLAIVLRRYPNVAQVEAVGSGLYGTFSTNIHRFSSRYTLVDSQWNALECDIMKALAPVSSNATAEGIDWQIERQRY